MAYEVAYDGSRASSFRGWNHTYRMLWEVLVVGSVASLVLE